ncbi:MAG: N-acetylglucosamine-6-phosphate deacetylase [Trueperaceae bacterium]
MDDDRFRGRWLLPDGVATGRVAVAGGRVAGFEPEALEDDGWWVPGFVDVHVHGGGGGDAMDGASGVRALAAAHLEHGTTALLPTTLTAPWPEVLAGLRGVAAVLHEDALAAATGGAPERRAAVLGAHLEGPFVSPQRLGAQPPFAVDPTPDRVAAVLALGVVRVVTLAPELAGAEGAATAFARAGVRVSLGHTVADAATAERVAEAVHDAGGVMGATHLFNAMSGMTGRAPGVIGAVLGDAASFAELIVDGHHLAAASVRAAFHAKGARLLLITDAIRATATTATTTRLGPHAVTIAGGAARLSDGTLAGSVLTLDAAVRTAVAMGVPVESALRAASQAPAAYLGLADRGRVAPRAHADFVRLDASLNVRSVWRGGVRVA